MNQKTIGMKTIQQLDSYKRFLLVDGGISNSASMKHYSQCDADCDRRTGWDETAVYCSYIVIVMQ